MTSGPRSVPATASVAQSGADGRLYAPAAARNAEAILSVLRRELPDSGSVLELASGTGEHAAQFAAALPGLIWHPSDVAPDRLASIDAHARAAGLTNLRPARRMDATRAGWADDMAPADAILLINLLHLISEAEAATLLAECQRALARGGVLLIYGPFLRNGSFASEGDRSFHDSLTRHDAQIGYKDQSWVTDHLTQAGRSDLRWHDMPANNLMLAARRAV